MKFFKDNILSKRLYIIVTLMNFQVIYIRIYITYDYYIFLLYINKYNKKIHYISKIFIKISLYEKFQVNNCYKD